MVFESSLDNLAGYSYREIPEIVKDWEDWKSLQIFDRLDWLGMVYFFMIWQVIRRKYWFCNFLKKRVQNNFGQVEIVLGRSNLFGLAQNVLEMGLKVKLSSERHFWSNPKQFGQIKNRSGI